MLPDYQDLLLLEPRLAEVEAPGVDSLAVEDWMGFAFDPSMIHDRDLWKYDKVLRELDARVAAHPEDVAARVYRGNGHYLRLGGGVEAARDYRAALEVDPENPSIRSNLNRLEAEGRADLPVQRLHLGSLRGRGPINIRWTRAA